MVFLIIFHMGSSGLSPLILAQSNKHYWVKSLSTTKSTPKAPKRLCPLVCLFSSRQFHQTIASPAESSLSADDHTQVVSSSDFGALFLGIYLLSAASTSPSLETSTPRLVTHCFPQHIPNTHFPCITHFEEQEQERF